MVSSGNGIWKSTNAGTNWVNTTNSWPCWRIAFKPGDPNTMYGTEIFGGDQYFDKSTDGGDNWDNGTLWGSGSDASRTELAVSANDPTAVYLLCAN